MGLETARVKDELDPPIESLKFLFSFSSSSSGIHPHSLSPIDSTVGLSYSIVRRARSLRRPTEALYSSLVLVRLVRAIDLLLFVCMLGEFDRGRVTDRILMSLSLYRIGWQLHPPIHQTVLEVEHSDWHVDFDHWNEIGDGSYPTHWWKSPADLLWPKVDLEDRKTTKIHEIRRERVENLKEQNPQWDQWETSSDHTWIYDRFVIVEQKGRDAISKTRKIEN